MCYVTMTNIQESMEREKTEKYMVSLSVSNSWLFISYLHSKGAQHWQ